MLVKKRSQSMIGNTLLNILKIGVIMFNILNYFLKDFKHMDSLLCLSNNIFFQPSFEFTKCEWKYDEKYDNAINCMKSRTPLLPNS